MVQRWVEDLRGSFGVLDAIICTQRQRVDEKLFREIADQDTSELKHIRKLKDADEQIEKILHCFKSQLIVFSVHSSSEVEARIEDRNEFVMLTHRFSCFTYIPAISRPGDEHESWAGETGHLQDLWQRKPLIANWGAQPTPSDSHVFLCGNPAVIEAMLSILSAEEFAEHTNKSPGQIHLERFW